MSILDSAVAIIVGTILLLLFSRLIGRVQFSFSTSFWCSLIGHIFTIIAALVAGFLLSNHLGVALVVAYGVGLVFQAILFQIAVRAKRGTLEQSRAAILSIIVICGDFFVASPLIELWEHFHN